MPLTRLLEMRHRRNPRRHNLDEIVLSIARNGFKAPPMIDGATSTMVAGHGRCLALERMKLAGAVVPDGIGMGGDGDWLVPALFSAFKSEQDRDAYLIADNRLTELAEYDQKDLTRILADLVGSAGGLAGTGYTEDELEELQAEADDLLDELDGDDDDEEKEVDVSGHTRVIGGHKVRPPAQMTNDDWTLTNVDCLEGLRKLEDNSIDALVTDPPAGISFMGRDWDGDKGGRDQWIQWLRAVMTECHRVLKPGGHGLVWALPRTSHWTAMALELAGFEIRDRVSHLFLSGFPKSFDLSKAVDTKLGAEREVIGSKLDLPGYHLQAGDGEGNTALGSGISSHTSEQRLRASQITAPATDQAEAMQGVGTALKPALEDWWLVRKPCEGSIVANVLKWGTGGINIDACRIPTNDDTRRPRSGVHDGATGETFQIRPRTADEKPQPDGRWPAHLAAGPGIEINDLELPAMYFYCPKPSKAETEAGLDDLPIATPGELTGGRAEGSAGLDNPRAGAGRTSGRRNIHPTKKPIALMRWLVRLIAPPERRTIAGEVAEAVPVVLDPFTGSGTTGMAALVEGCKFVGFEREAAYHAIASERMRSIIEDPRLADEAEDPEPDDELEAEDETD